MLDARRLEDDELERRIKRSAPSPNCDRFDKLSRLPLPYDDTGDCMREDLIPSAGYEDEVLRGRLESDSGEGACDRARLKDSSSK